MEDIKKLVRDAVRQEIDDIELRVAINEAGLQAALSLGCAIAHTIPKALRKEIEEDFDRRIEQTLASMLHDAGDRTGAQYNRLEALRSDILASLRDGGS